MEKGAQSVIIVKKKRGHGHGHHGGSWKVALADFMTAMMAFFLLMWLLESATPAEQAAIAGYFQNPDKYVIGPGGADAGVIDLTPKPKEADPTEIINQTTQGTSSMMSPDAVIEEEELRQRLEQAEQKLLEELKLQLEEQINSMGSVFEQLKDQIIIDFTALGLRIQIVDKEQRPMFDVGSARLKSYSRDVLHALAPIINTVPNKISINGHTDSIPYGVGAAYTNWELSADRANSARRALLEGKFPESKVIAVQGMGSIAPLLVDKPTAPVNRRIAIIVLKKTVAEALSNGGSGIKSTDLTGAVSPQSSTAVDAAQRIMSEAEVDAAIDAAREDQNDHKAQKD